MAPKAISSDAATMAVGRSAAEKQVRRAEVCSAAASAVQSQLRTHSLSKRYAVGPEVSSEGPATGLGGEDVGHVARDGPDGRSGGGPGR